MEAALTAGGGYPLSEAEAEALLPAPKSLRSSAKSPVRPPRPSEVVGKENRSTAVSKAGSLIYKSMKSLKASADVPLAAPPPAWPHPRASAVPPHPCLAVVALEQVLRSHEAHVLELFRRASQQHVALGRDALLELVQCLLPRATPGDMRKVDELLACHGDGMVSFHDLRDAVGAYKAAADVLCAWQAVWRAYHAGSGVQPRAAHAPACPLLAAALPAAGHAVADAFRTAEAEAEEGEVGVSPGTAVKLLRRLLPTVPRAELFLLVASLHMQGAKQGARWVTLARVVATAEGGGALDAPPSPVPPVPPAKAHTLRARDSADHVNLGTLSAAGLFNQVHAELGAIDPIAAPSAAPIVSTPPLVVEDTEVAPSPVLNQASKSTDAHSASTEPAAAAAHPLLCTSTPALQAAAGMVTSVKKGNLAETGSSTEAVAVLVAKVVASVVADPAVMAPSERVPEVPNAAQPTPVVPELVLNAQPAAAKAAQEATKAKEGELASAAAASAAAAAQPSAAKAAEPAAKAESTTAAAGMWGRLETRSPNAQHLARLIAE
jgi:hypothetical protein